MILPVDHVAAKQFVAARLLTQKVSETPRTWLGVDGLRGRLLKNMATTKVYHLDVGALPLKIADKEYRRGVYFPSEEKIVVNLPSAARSQRP
ncbi:MAG: hypothetical protein MK106_16270 [Mariniblastus sp.]|nr:hypothetical protein [Mariniblastus sp.]